MHTTETQFLILDSEQTINLWTLTEIRKRLHAGETLSPACEHSQALPEFTGKAPFPENFEVKEPEYGHRTAKKPPTTPRKQVKKKPVAVKKGSIATKTKKLGRIFTKTEQLKGAIAGGKARAMKMTAKQRSESARKAVIARWRKKR